MGVIRSTAEKISEVMGLLKVLIIVIIVILIGGSVFFLVDRLSSNKPNAVTETAKIVEAAPEAVIEPVITAVKTQTAEAAKEAERAAKGGFFAGIGLAIKALLTNIGAFFTGIFGKDK
jgi:flagellar basal body-associated protein FliL